MSKFKKEYVFPIRSEEDRQKIRDWVGTHNGMSILKSDWCYTPAGISVECIDTYILGITNPKTEMLFLLKFPEVVDKDELDHNANMEWGWTVTAPSK